METTIILSIHFLPADQAVVTEFILWQTQEIICSTGPDRLTAPLRKGESCWVK